MRLHGLKQNESRFPRAQNRSGKGLEILSVFSTKNLDADKKSFSALMRHLKESDKARTVIMVQVENEIGMLEENILPMPIKLLIPKCQMN